MKLKSIRVDTVESDYVIGSESSINHDALAAHALLQAIKEKSNPPSLHGVAAERLLFEITWRADELMREWTTSEPSSTPR